MFVKVKQIMSSEEIKQLEPVTPQIAAIKARRDEEAKAILRGDDKRLMVIVGPCSADNEPAVCDYVYRLAGLAEKIKDKIFNANVYFGHEPTLACLEQGANVVITGRSTDSALFLAPCMHKMGWAPNDWNNLARGIMAGHLLECGGQGAGGNYDYGWRDVPRMDELGFPIAEITPDSFHITKAPDCGGIICEQSCKEQFLYEVHDPANYITPDVVVDISNATLTQDGENRVRVGSVKGKQRPDTLKLSIGYHAGFKVAGMLSFAWPDAYEKAQYAAEIIMKKMKRKGLQYEDIRIDYIGLNALHLDVADAASCFALATALGCRDASEGRQAVGVGRVVVVGAAVRVHGAEVVRVAGVRRTLPPPVGAFNGLRPCGHCTSSCRSRARPL